MSEQIIIFSQIVFIDLVLAGDNAIIIGMVASQFPPDQRKKIIFWGIGAAVVLRIILTLLTAYLLQITGLRLIGGLALLYICYKLYSDVIKKSSKDNEKINVKGIAHITGGGLTENIPRILPNECSVKIQKGTWPSLPIFDTLKNLGNVEEEEMYQAFNMGIGMVLILDKDSSQSARNAIREYSQSFELGTVVSGHKVVKIL